MATTDTEPTAEAKTTTIGRFRPASRIREGWQLLKTDGTWVTVKRAMQITKPLRVTSLTLSDGTKPGCSANTELMCRTPSEVERAAKAGA